MGEKPSNVAIIALCLSIGTAAFSIYQWWSGQRASRIATAVDISNKYIDNRDAIHPYELVDKIQRQGDRASEDDKRRFEAFSNRLEYIAYLANRDQIDADYISEILRCDIVLASSAIKLLQKDQNVRVIEKLPPNIEMEAFRGRLSGHWSCRLNDSGL